MSEGEAYEVSGLSSAPNTITPLKTSQHITNYNVLFQGSHSGSNCVCSGTTGVEATSNVTVNGLNGQQTVTNEDDPKDGLNRTNNSAMDEGRKDGATNRLNVGLNANGSNGDKTINVDGKYDGLGVVLLIGATAQVVTGNLGSYFPTW